MFGVGRLGSYISRGVYRVSTPFPLGGAVDIIVVEQQDGSFKSTPWYVRFGKFQGTLTERLVTINVNGIDADFHMYLDHKGEAFFIREVDGTEAESESESYLSSGDDMVDVKADSWWKHKSKSCNFDAGKELDGSPRKSLSRSNSRRGRIFGLPIGRRSMKANGYQDYKANAEAERVSSIERAEIAADLLEVRWSTNLQTGKNRNVRGSDGSIVVDSSKGQCNKESDSQFSSSKVNAMEYTLEETYMAIHSNSTENGSTKPSQRVVNERIEGRGVPCKDKNDSQDGVGTSPQRGRGEGFVGEIVGTKEVEEAPLSGTSTAELCKSAIGSVNVLSSEEFSAAVGDLKSLPSVLEKENSIGNVGESAVISSAIESCRDSIDRSTASDDSKEEQFVFSDLDEPKLGKGQHSKSSSFGSAEWLSPSGSSDDGESNTIVLGDSNQVASRPTQDILCVDCPSPRLNPNRVSSPIGISKTHNDADVAALVPVVESLPNMVLDGDDLSLNATQPLGRSLDSTLEAFKMVDDDVAIDEAQQQMVHLHSNNSQISEEIRQIISDPAIEVSLCRRLLFEGMGYEAAARAFDTEKLDMDKFLSLGRDILENDKLVVRIGGLYFPWDAALPIASAIGSQGHVQNLEPKGMIAVGEVDDGTSEGVALNSINSRSGSWRMWPFSSKRTNSIRNRNSTSDINTPQTKETVGAIDTVKPSVIKKKLRAKFPTSEQLGSLNLKEGKNSVTFTFSTAMFGEQQVDARIFLWKWNSRIVISDVDGTITKSDVLGQFMPLMGYDWSQTGVTHLFSAIKENGYELLFLSARSISQAYLTRQFLINLKQDGKALPEGPVLISPDGLFPSLYREVIRRAPHEFKIACLEDVKVLFPEDHNPFYAGFGNRDTDELSYLKVGIPRGKIFTINPRGEVVVNRRVDTKSYTSLHALVHDMFPPTTMHEQEDYNSWNFWRLPPPDAII